MKTVPTSAIINAYTRVGTAEEIAFCLNIYYRMHTHPISAHYVEDVWATELETNILLRELGPRPPKGFPLTDGLTLVEKLVMA